MISIQSHVVFGHAGNSAAVFPMQRCGVNVWPLHTVQFSNHTQYAEGFRGMRIPPEQIGEIGIGLDAIGSLQDCDAVLSGYLGSVEQGDEVLQLVKKVKEANTDALYCCDPVMGHPEKGCIVSEGVEKFFRDEALKVCTHARMQHGNSVASLMCAYELLRAALMCVCGQRCNARIPWC